MLRMGIYHQIGHDCINLLKEKALSPFAGLIWSPVNYLEEEVTSSNLSLPKKFSRFLDPQLYFPAGEKENLHAWDYYPDDFETSDNTNPAYWDSISKALIKTCIRTGCKTLCSPAPILNQCNNAYYDFFTDRANFAVEYASDTDVTILQTVVIKLAEIEGAGCIEKIASILSRSNASGFYLIFSSSTTPRRELCSSEQLTNAMKLIFLLKQCGLRVTVGFCSSDFVLWRYAGADDIATGKFFNLRRFTATRFLEEENGGGGGQLPYLFDKSYLSFFREGDIIRLERRGLLDSEIEQNPYNVEIMNIVRSRSHRAWVALSWRSYLYSMMTLESSLVSHDEKIASMLNTAEKRWEFLRNSNLLMEEVPNNGSWIRNWRIALNEFDDFLNDI